MGGKRWTDTEVATLREHYGQHKSRQVLLDLLPGRTYDAISMKAFFLGLEGDPRNSNRRYDVRFDTFSEMTPDAAYWAGFIAADGHITPNSQLCVGLAPKDAEHLCKLKTYLGYTGNITRGTHHTTFGEYERVDMVVQSVDICRDLANNFGIPAGKKSDVLRLPSLNDNLLLDYVAGYFDGDGCLYRSKKGYLTITFVGNHDFLMGVRDLFHRQFEFETSEPYKNVKHSDAELYRVHGANAVLVLRRFAQNPNGMKRKRL